MVPVYVHSLSSLMPVKLVYKFNKPENLACTLHSYKNGFNYYKYEGLENYQDAVLSNKTCLILTDNVSLKTVFESDSKEISVGNIAGCLYLQASSGELAGTYIKMLSEGVYVGGTGTNMLINIAPIQNNLVELKIGKDLFCQVDKHYPYTLRVTKEVLDGDDIKRQQFEMEYRDNLVAFRTLTEEGWRYVSYGVDRVVRAIGLMLNETAVNSYLFTPKFISNSSIHYNFDAKTSEVKYYNDIATYNNRGNVSVRYAQETNTSLLVSTPTSHISKSSEVSVNIALTKTNFSSSGSYTTKQTP